MSGCQEEAAAITYGVEKAKFQIWEYIHTNICKDCFNQHIKDGCPIDCKAYKIKEFIDSKII